MKTLLPIHHLQFTTHLSSVDNKFRKTTFSPHLRITKLLPQFAPCLSLNRNNVIIMNLLKLIAGTGLSVLAIAAITSCNSGPSTEKKGPDSTKMAAAKPVPGTPIKYDSSKRYIFLTWDDSPQPPGTVNCKAVFQAEGIKATFFSVGFNQVGPWKKRLIDSIRNGYPHLSGIRQNLYPHHHIHPQQRSYRPSSHQ